MSNVSVSMKLTQKQAGALYMKCIALEDRLAAAKAAYVNLTNCQSYSDNGDLVGVLCKKSVLDQFDAVFGDQS